MNIGFIILILLLYGLCMGGLIYQCYTERNTHDSVVWRCIYCFSSEFRAQENAKAREHVDRLHSAHITRSDITNLERKIEMLGRNKEPSPQPPRPDRNRPFAPMSDQEKKRTYPSQHTKQPDTNPYYCEDQKTISHNTNEVSRIVPVSAPPAAVKIESPPSYYTVSGSRKPPPPQSSTGSRIPLPPKSSSSRMPSSPESSSSLAQPPAKSVSLKEKENDSAPLPHERDIVEKIRDLNQFKQDGVLTEEEFQKAKDRLFKQDS